MAKSVRHGRKEGVHLERGSIVKGQKGLIRTALVYPNTYQAGMSSLGFQTVYGLINDLDHVVAERVFMPDDPEAEVLSVESGKNLSWFDILFFSISFENDYLNLISMLERSNIPMRGAGRNESHPLVVAGGVASFLNPEPLAEFMDLLLLGEAELLIPPFFDVYTPLMSRQTLFERLASTVGGVYVPSWYSPVHNSGGEFIGMEKRNDQAPDRVRVRRVTTLKETCATRVITADTAFKNTFLIETGRGCPHGCRFCSAGFIYRPPRFYPEDVVTRALDAAKALTSRVGLVSAAVSDHPAINSICARGIAEDLSISFSSLRADALTDELIATLQRSGVKTATIAPEAGSERMRAIINKKISETEIVSAADRLVKAGIINLKLYYMIGLPFEEDGDVAAIVSLTQKIREVFLSASRKKKKIGTITLSINPFIPKPATPFQWAPMAKIGLLKHRLKIIQEGLKRVPNIQLKWESFRMARINALLSRGGRQTAGILEDAAKNGWSKAVRNADAYCEAVVHTEREKDEPFPWEIVDTCVKREFLWKEYQRSKTGKVSPDCPMIDCRDCGICRIP
ncbi:radical SAM domain protein [Desulforapulum autotrophicum HRM2]|uniref:Radical SAM domain protein n=1 Tax=Desulforapulum autotrophicum (strain ATCC 43914 / DSM 3382 / VKM B-1955 / HRM2) TaxID=177437 RepID=C0Q8P9_DESAH|nr:radical SAM protein [Desulforapulum autotrophicum]ACN14389.1 radical SAM domain protein [Desulforapulum autotrophicum HRM2]